MLNRTTSYAFQSFGDVLYQMPQTVTDYNTRASFIHNKTFDTSYISTKPVYLECTEGIALLAVSVDGANFEEFILHHVVKLKAGVHYNLIAISSKPRIICKYAADTLASHPMENQVAYDPIISRLHIKEILTSYYQVRKGSYASNKAKNNYYELVYVDHGNMEVLIEDELFQLEKHDLIVLYPGSRHAVTTLEDSSCSYLTIAFTMDSQLEESLENRVFRTRKDIYQILSKYMTSIQEGSALHMELAMLYLKEVLILLYQTRSHAVPAPAEHALHADYESTLLNEILVFIHNNVYTSYTIEDLCKKFSISRSSLQTLFRSNLSTTPKQYISELKLTEAKKLIAQKNHTISEISDLLGFTSIHYFSRRFKNYFGIAPTDYAKSVQNN